VTCDFVYLTEFGAAAASRSAVQCAVVMNDVTSAGSEAEGRRDSGISVASSLVTTCTSEQHAVVSQQQAVIVEEPPSTDVLSASDIASQPLSGTDNTVPAILPWISLTTLQGHSRDFFLLLFFYSWLRQRP